jgi:general secretion pathway protein M
MEQLKAAIAELQTWFSRLSERERRLVVIAGSAAGAFLILVIFISFAASASSTRSRTEAKLAKLRDIQALAANYDQAQAARANVERDLTAGDVSLTTYIEGIGNSAQLQIPTMNPKADVPIGDGVIIESSVEITLNEITLRQLHDFLANAERGPGVVKVKYLKIEPRPDNQTLTAFTTIATYRLKEGAANGRQ